MNLLFYDTETSGLPLFDRPSEDPRQPHIVQLAACLVDESTRQTISTIDLIARPDGWTIPDDVAAIHGITTERAGDVGVPEVSILAAFVALWNPRLTRVAHNESFDARIVRIALKRFGESSVGDLWKGGDAECTALLATPIMKMPATEAMRATGRNGAKKPKLIEAYKHFTGQDMPNAHTAIGDVLGCMAVYWAIKDGAQ